MNLAPVIAKNGKKIQWTSMSGQGKVYDSSTGTMVGGAAVTRTISAVLDGYGSLESQLRFEQFRTGELVGKGGARIFCVENIKPGDKVQIDDIMYTVRHSKSVWKKDVVVLYEALVQQ
jgi:hypothetical protein